MAGPRTAPGGRPSRARALLVALAGIAALSGAVVPPSPARAETGAGPVPAAGGPSAAAPSPADAGPAGSGGVSGLAAQESAVLMRIARLSDQIDRTQSSLVDSQLAHAAATASYYRMRRAVVGMIVQAYVDDSPLGGAPSSAPGPYVEVAATAARGLVERYQAQVRRYASQEADYERSLSGLRADQARLDAQRQALDVLVSAAAAAEERRRSADAAALAASDAARTALGSGAASGGNPDHTAATAAQAAAMARWPFGPLPVADGNPVLPRSLVPVGPPLSGTASWYGPGFDGQPTASGAIYDENLWTVASPDLPLGTMLVVSCQGRSVLLLVNDRGPYVAGRILDLSHAAAGALGFDGLADVTARVVVPGS